MTFDLPERKAFFQVGRRSYVEFLHVEGEPRNEVNSTNAAPDFNSHFILNAIFHYIL